MGVDLVYMHTYIHIQNHVCLAAKYLNVYIHICMHANILVYIPIYLHKTWLHALIHMWIHIYVLKDAYTLAYLATCIHTWRLVHD